MIHKMKKLIDVLIRPKLFKQFISMNSSGYLKEIGWIESFTCQLPIDKEHNPLPWVTYSFIDFIEDRLNKNMTIFEYGSGNSTLWYSKKVKLVISVEHDKKWYERIKNDMPENVKIHYKELIYGGDYARFTSTITERFNIIIVDGRDRVNCLKQSINSVSKDGVIVLDDSERDAYKEGIDFLLKNNFKKIDFWGISPGLFYKKCTTVFYKNNNCLGI